MNVQLLFFLLLIGTAALLAYGVVAAIGRRRRGEPTPPYAVGNIADGLTILLLVAAQLIGLESRLGRSMLAISLVLLVVAVWQTVRAGRAAAA